MSTCIKTVKNIIFNGPSAPQPLGFTHQYVINQSFIDYLKFHH